MSYKGMNQHMCNLHELAYAVINLINIVSQPSTMNRCL